jgi:hypothetical protein
MKAQDGIAVFGIRENDLFDRPLNPFYRFIVGYLFSDYFPGFPDWTIS